MDEQRRIVHRDDDYEVTCNVPDGVTVLSGIERIETRHGIVYAMPRFTMNSGRPVEA